MGEKLTETSYRFSNIELLKMQVEEREFPPAGSVEPCQYEVYVDIKNRMSVQVFEEKVIGCGIDLEDKTKNLSNP